MKIAALGLATLLAGCYDLGHLTKNHGVDGGPDGGGDLAVLMNPDGGMATSVSVYAGAPGGGGSANGVGTAAFLDQPEGVALDSKSFYVVDSGSSTIVAIDRTTMQVSRLAGSPWRPGQGAAPLYAPLYAVTLGGALYFTDAGYVRRLNANGSIDDIIGNHGYGSCSGAFGATRTADPYGISTDGTYLFVSEEDGDIICQLDLTSGMATTLTGTLDVYSYMDGPAAGALFRSPTSAAPMTLNGQPGLLISDANNRLLRFYDSATSNVSTYAGALGMCNFQTGPLLGGAQFCLSWQVIAPPDGKIYFTEDYAHAIVSIDPSAMTPQTTVLAGGMTRGYKDGTGAQAQLSTPRGLVEVSSSMGPGVALLVADRDNHVVRQVDTATGDVTTVIGSAEHRGNTDGPIAAARFAAPLGLATDGTTLYVADSANTTIRAIANGSVGTLTLTGGTTGIALQQPGAIAVAPDGSLYVVDLAQDEVFHVTSPSSSPQIAPFITNMPDLDGGTPYDGGVGGVLSGALGIAVDADTVYVADTNHDVVHTFSLGGMLTGRVDLGIDGLMNVGCGTGTGLQAPAGLALDLASHTLYVAARDNCEVYAYDTQAKTAKLIAGSTRGHADGALGTLDAPTGLALDGMGHLFIVDSANATIRRLDLASGFLSTYAGTVDQAGIVPGPAPAQVNRGFGLAFLPGVGLVASMPSENALVRIQ